MSGALRYVCVQATPVRVAGGIPTIIKRGALVDGDSDVVLANPENFRPASPTDALVRRRDVDGQPTSWTPATLPEVTKPISFGRKKENER